MTGSDSFEQRNMLPTGQRSTLKSIVGHSFFSKASLINLSVIICPVTFATAPRHETAKCWSYTAIYNDLVSGAYKS